MKNFFSQFVILLQVHDIDVHEDLGVFRADRDGRRQARAIAWLHNKDRDADDYFRAKIHIVKVGYGWPEKRRKHFAKRYRNQKVREFKAGDTVRTRFELPCVWDAAPKDAPSDHLHPEYLDVTGKLLNINRVTGWCVVQLPTGECFGSDIDDLIKVVVQEKLDGERRVYLAPAG